MAKVTVLNQLGEQVKELTLDDSVFAVEPNMQVVYDVVNAQRAGMRQGTHDTKNRTEVSGGGKKPYRQKGTGRARQGSIRAPQWRGGGIVFGPTPRSYAVKTNRKVVQKAVKCLLSSRLNENALVVCDKFELDTFKTKALVEILTNLKVSGKILVITEEENYNLAVSGANIPNVYVQTRNHLSVYDLINADCYVMDEAAVMKYEEVLK